MSSIINASTTSGLVISSDTSGILQLQNNGTTVATISSTGLASTTNAKAWARFNTSSGSAVISSSFNISSITVVSTGLYTYNFTNALTDANYVAVAMAGGTGTTPAAIVIRIAGTPSTSSFQTYQDTAGVGAANSVYQNIIVLGN